MNCPGVKKGLVSEDYIKNAMALWSDNITQREWVEEYVKNDNPKNYDWISIDDYLNYKNSIKQ
ncbi:MAG: hypothetical protein PHW96_03745 [Candidatus Nanoarchaeia archaeon]|nr:hypothetical protein [Candidatus Nanoarchaeia archaeon]